MHAAVNVYIQAGKEKKPGCLSAELVRVKLPGTSLSTWPQCQIQGWSYQR